MRNELETVLVVDDDPIFRRFVRSLLEPVTASPT
jgi:CheY-like chemotaxis protein